ncbi:MAG: class I SAM-dependent methyltransferase [Halioglobus sp.]
MKIHTEHLEGRFGKPMANLSFSIMQHYIHGAQKRGIGMMHTARSFAAYRKVFYQNRPRSVVMNQLQGKRIVDVGCGYTPYADDSMFRAAYEAGVEFYGIDPLICTDIRFSLKDRMLARATGGSGHFKVGPAGIDKAIGTTAQNLPFDDQSIDEILCSYLLFVWIEDEATLADIFEEFRRVLKPGGVAKIYPLYEWQNNQFTHKRLIRALQSFDIEQRFILGGPISRVMSSMLTLMTKR